MFASIDTHICQQHQGHTYREKSGLAFMVQKDTISPVFVCCHWFKKNAQNSWHQQPPPFSPSGIQRCLRFSHGVRNDDGSIKPSYHPHMSGPK